jgi:hypothetical protein
MTHLNFIHQFAKTPKEELMKYGMTLERMIQAHNCPLLVLPELTIGFIPICLSVCLSVHKVFQTFSHYVRSYCIETLYMALYQLTYRSSLEMVAIDQFLEELCPLTDFTVFRTFFLCTYRYSFHIWYIDLPYQDKDQV